MEVDPSNNPGLVDTGESDDEIDSDSEEEEETEKKRKKKVIHFNEFVCVCVVLLCVLFCSAMFCYVALNRVLRAVELSSFLLSV